MMNMSVRHGAARQTSPADGILNEWLGRAQEKDLTLETPHAKVNKSVGRKTVGEKNDP